jgi:hypothetical protein
MTATLSERSHALFEAKAKKKELNDQIIELNKKIRKLEMNIWEVMDDDDLLKFETPDGTVYISPQVVPKVVDWNAFYGYIKETEAFHMLERRPSRAAFRELHEAHKPVPGVEAVEFDQVRTRKS